MKTVYLLRVLLKQTIAGIYSLRPTSQDVIYIKALIDKLTDSNIKENLFEDNPKYHYFIETGCFIQRKKANITACLLCSYQTYAN